MRRIATTLLILACTAVALGAQGGGPAGWKKYTSADGRYSVWLPGEPELSTQEATAPSGEKLKQHLAQAADDNSLMMIGYFDYAGGGFDLDKARDGMVDAIKGTLVSERDIKLDQNPGREMIISVKAPNGEDYFVRARYYDTRGRVYVVQCIFRKADETPALTEKYEKYFDSFKVEPAK